MEDGGRKALGRQAGRQQASAAPGPWGVVLPTTNKEGGAGSNAGLAERVLAASWCGIEAQPRSWMLLSVRPPPPPPAVPGGGRQQTRKQAHTIQRPMLRGGIAQFFVGLWLGPEEEEGLGCPCLRGSRTPLRLSLSFYIKMGAQRPINLKKAHYGARVFARERSRRFCGLPLKYLTREAQVRLPLGCSGGPQSLGGKKVGPLPCLDVAPPGSAPAAFVGVRNLTPPVSPRRPEATDVPTASDLGELPADWTCRSDHHRSDWHYILQGRGTACGWRAPQGSPPGPCCPPWWWSTRVTPPHPSRLWDGPSREPCTCESPMVGS